ncbi:MAG: enoyl-CoA hydratase/isomerase family protein [Ferruginibacter sp.]
MQTDNGYVKSGTEDGITTIVFFHPQSNSLPAVILSQLTEAINHAAKNSRTKVIVLKSEGEKSFCAGASFNELAGIENKESGQSFFSGFANVINAMRKCDKVIIARIQGRCVGGGVGLAAAADYAIAVKNADVKLSELAVGIGPFVVGPAVERKIGMAAFSALTIDATNWRTGQWAFEKGLFAEIYDSINQVDNAVKSLAEKLAASNPEAMAAIKQICWQGTEDWDNLLQDRAGISGQLVTSTFTKNAIGAFKLSKK